MSWYGSPTVTLTVPSELLSIGPDAAGWTELLLPLTDGDAPSRARMVAYSGAMVRGGTIHRDTREQ
jgi:hypothetical protein